jgi:hypothetical protein
MTSEAKLIGSGGRLNADARPKVEDEGLPWLHDGSEDEPEALPNVVVPKLIQTPAGQASPASSPAQLAPRSARKEVFSTVLELAGIVTLSVGFFMVSPALGLIVSGLSMVLLGVATSDFGK